MTKEELKKVQQLSWDIDALEYELRSIEEVLVDFDHYGSTISFTRNSDRTSRSFGSKKHNFKKELKGILLSMKEDKLKELKELKNKFNKITVL